MSDKQTITISSLNVRGISLKYERVLNLLNTKRVDIACLQETKHVADKTKNKIEKKWKGKILWNTGLGAGEGIAFFISKKVLGEIIIEKNENKIMGRCSTLYFTINENKYMLCNIYAPSQKQERKIFYSKLNKEFINENTDNKKVICAGDFNCTENESLDRQPDIVRNDSSKTEMNKMLRQMNINDIYRRLNPASKTYTWRNVHGSKARLDRIYSTKNMNNHIISIESQIVTFSDHDMVTCKISISSSKHQRNRRGTWKLNVSCLNDDKLIKKLETFHINWRDACSVYRRKTDWWEQAKIEYKRILINYGIEKARMSKEECKHIEEQLTNLRQKQDRGEKVNNHDIMELTSRYEKIESDKLMGAKIRSRVQHFEEGEKTQHSF